MTAKRTLTRFRAPDERGAEERAWEAVRSSYQDRQPVANRRSYGRPAAAFAAGLVLVAAFALSPAGATVGRLITRALGVKHAKPALVSLPAPGRLLVSGPGGTWTVAADGSARRLGPWALASWSPRGLYLTVAGANELEAVTPRGMPRWTIARPAVSDPRWYQPTGYRVAYLSRDRLRVVAGDGTGDHLLAAAVAPIAPAWRPGHPYQLAYVTAGGELAVRDGDTGALVWMARPGVRPSQIAWSGDGRRLLALSAHVVLIYSAGGKLLAREAAPGGGPVIDGALSPDGRALALITSGGSSAVVVDGLGSRHPVVRRVLPGPGLAQVAWSPDGKWILISWPAADQWVFVRVLGMPRILAISRIAQQFSTPIQHGFPRLEGWCCSTAATAG